MWDKSENAEDLYFLQINFFQFVGKIFYLKNNSSDQHFGGKIFLPNIICYKRYFIKTNLFDKYFIGNIFYAKK